MEVAQYYINRYHKAMDALNVLSPSIEPHASGHIIEQIELVKGDIEERICLRSEGSVYFDVENTIRTITTASSPDATWMMFSTPPANWTDRARSTTRRLCPLEMCATGTHHALAFPWSDGFPGWHAECTAMGKEILGRALRHSWWRHGPYLPASRMRDCTIRSFPRGRYGTLDAQQHADRERTENG